MFSELESYRVRVHEKKRSKQHIHYLPNIIAIHPLDSLFASIEWLFNDAIKDYNRTHRSINRRRSKYGVSQKNLDAYDSLAIRLGSRTQNYVNQVCLMEDLLIYEYKRIAEFVKKVDSRNFSFNPDKEFKPLTKRLAKIRLFRNKVVAHTAYTNPILKRRKGRIKDNPDTIVRSVMNLFPSPGEIYLGNNQFVTTKFKQQIPSLTIFNWRDEVKPVFEDWKELYITRLEKIHKKCPYQNGSFRIETATPHLLRRVQH